MAPMLVELSLSVDEAAVDEELLPATVAVEYFAVIAPESALRKVVDWEEVTEARADELLVTV